MNYPLYRRLALALRWQSQVNETFRDKADDRVQACLDELPHGSGIDADWYASATFTGDDVKKITLTNSYHSMDENGFYDGWTDFAVVITPSLENGFNLRVTGSFPARYADTRDYLAETLDYVLRQDGE